MPPVAEVPLAKPWFRGLANIRGNLFSVIDFAGFLGRGNVPAAAQNRLVLFGPRTGDLRAGIVVARVLGLRNLAELAPAAAVTDAPSWYAQRWIDASGGAWQEIDLARLARDPAFLQVGA
jgi:twitching motility protein PilI